MLTIFSIFKKANKMRTIGDVKSAIKIFEENKSLNLRFLLKERFDWMNDFINEGDHGVELGICKTLHK